MRKRSTSPGKRHKGGKILPALCNLLGILIILAVIAGCLAILLPQARNYQVFRVITGSMEPEIPIGSIVYVQSTPAKDVVTGDVIAFRSGNRVITHRVVMNDVVEGKFSTKGDANPVEDENRVDYGELIGVVVRHYPHLGEFLVFYSNPIGKIYLFLFVACGAMLNVLASRLRARHKEWDAFVDAMEQETKKSIPPTPPEV